MVLVTHTYQSEVPAQRLNTRIELGFWDEMVLLKMLMNMGLPKMRGLLVMTMASISPSGMEVPPAKSLRRRSKVLLPKFHLGKAALCPESPPFIFSRSKYLIYQKMGTGGWPRRPQPTRARQGGLARPGGLCPPGGPPLVFIGSSISQIIHKKSYEVSPHLELCRIGGLM